MYAGDGGFLDYLSVESTEEILDETHYHCSTYTVNSSYDGNGRVFDYIEQYPIIDIKRTASDLEVSYNTVSAAVGKLVQAGILKETTNASRNRVFSYEEYLNILRKDT